MKAHELISDRKRAVIEQLEKLGSRDNEHYTYEELVRKLSAARALDVKVVSPNQQWF